MQNATYFVFTDISSEEFREYLFAGGDIVKIIAPTHLNVSASGGHRIFDASGGSHYIPAGWLHLRWRARSGMPNFAA